MRYHNDYVAEVQEDTSTIIGKVIDLAQDEVSVGLFTLNIIP